MRVSVMLGLAVAEKSSRDGIEPKKFYYPLRQQQTLPLEPGSKEKPVVLSYKKSLRDYCDGDSGSLTVVFKDLGTQVSSRALFFFEYLGLYPVFYFFHVYKYLGYKRQHVIQPVQMYALYYWCLHYFKWIMETFVNRFSRATSPLSNVFLNFTYYWTFGCCIASYMNYHLYTPLRDLQMRNRFAFRLLC